MALHMAGGWWRCGRHTHRRRRAIPVLTLRACVAAILDSSGAAGGGGTGSSSSPSRRSPPPTFAKLKRQYGKKSNPKASSAMTIFRMALRMPLNKTRAVSAAMRSIGLSPTSPLSFTDLLRMCVCACD